jgi:hypothetical protein
MFVRAVHVQVYLFIKEISNTTDRDDVIIVTSSLVHDMNSKDDLYKANAMRVLAKIIDATMLGTVALPDFLHAFVWCMMYLHQQGPSRDTSSKP